MLTILLIGAGRSSGALIDYLLRFAQADSYRLVIADQAAPNFKDSSLCTSIKLDISDTEELRKEIAKSSLVISLLPAHLHLPVARLCIDEGRSLLTASYVSPEMQKLDEAARSKGLLLLNECGLDPGIDHMSAFLLLQKLRRGQAEIISFRSYTGGLVHPDDAGHLWQYKFSWNPRNVILAGQGTARFREAGKIRFTPYNRLFSECRLIEMGDSEKFDGYANRDSLGYSAVYGLDTAETLIRGTLRYHGFCSAWQILVDLGWTDDSYRIAPEQIANAAALTEALLPTSSTSLSIEERIARFAGVAIDSPEMKKIIASGILNQEPLHLKAEISPAALLQQLLEARWKLMPGDRDRVLMIHEIGYRVKEEFYKTTSWLDVNGDQESTAMARTVGLPLGIVARKMLAAKINLLGVQIPVDESLSEMVLQELEDYGIIFQEKTIPVSAQMAG